jgi:hypothetical protein
MNKIYYAIIYLILVSCASKVRDSELYGKCETPMYGCTQLKLNTDKTFEYFVFEDVGGESLTKGTWKAHYGDTIILNSYKQPIEEKIDTEETIFINSNREYIVNQLIILKRNKVIYIPQNKNIKIFSLRKIKLNEKKWN